MDWLEISVETVTLGADVVSELMIRFGAKGTQIIDRADLPDPDKPGENWIMVDRSLRESMPEAVIVKAWLPKDSDLLPLREALQSLPAVTGMDLGSLRLTVENVQDKEWAEYWKRFYKPFHLGDRLVVRPSWEQYQAKPDDLVIHLDPGMAFGTGTHESTALCARLIEKHYQGGRVLDVGTGSGILAIAAALLGASDVLAIDIDPTAVRTARENVKKNGLSGQISVQTGDLIKGVEGRFQLAVANILADVIITLARPLRANLLPGAVFICSGIIRERAQDVLEALTGMGYELLDDSRQGEWVAFAFRVPV